MPELPDLEVYCKNLKKNLEGQKLQNIKVYDVFRVTAVEDQFNEKCAGQMLTSLERDGKELFFIFDNGNNIAVHLMLNGTFSLHSEASELDRLKKKCAALFFENRILLVSDYGDLCKIKLNPVRNTTPDVFKDEFTLEYFTKKVKSRKKMVIKALLINQKILKGIGNAYADEILYAAKVAPNSWCNHLPDEKITDLYSSIRSVLQHGVEEIEKENPERISGEYRDFMEVHVRNKAATASGARIVVKQIANKKTYYTDEQTLYGPDKPLFR